MHHYNDEPFIMLYIIMAPNYSVIMVLSCIYTVVVKYVLYVDDNEKGYYPTMSTGFGGRIHLQPNAHSDRATLSVKHKNDNIHISWIITEYENRIHSTAQLKPNIFFLKFVHVISNTCDHAFRLQNIINEHERSDLLVVRGTFRHLRLPLAMGLQINGHM